MTDYTELKRKFRAKKAVPNRVRTKLAVKAIAREYELKRAELAGGPPVLRRGPLFYGLVILLLVALGAFIVPAILNGSLSLGRKRIERNALQARKAMDALSMALGRYRFHVGAYPTDDEGLAVLAFRQPEEIRRIRAAHPGWDGPYVNHIVRDPWGHDYVYETRPDGGNPVLYSKGPDGRAGTTDDVLPDQLAFESAFRDTSWTNNWAPCELRGVVIAPNEATKQSVERAMRRYD